MRHRVAGRKLGRKTNHRRAMWRNMTVSLLAHGQITTTIPKAKSLQPFVEKLLTVAKRGDLAARRQAMKMLGQDFVIVRDGDDTEAPRNSYGEIDRKGGRLQGPRILKHLFEEVAPRYSDRNGGCTRIIKLGSHRIGDGADLCVIQLISEDDTGPQVAGQFSRRREKANRRMAFAAQLRKGGKAEAEVAEEPSAPAEEAPPEAAEEQAPEATDTGEATEGEGDKDKQ
ncbi:50S ribosomal protein L17 [Natronomicrosphaera hydrolytica]|uniref:50S ribosomal protein L17 n=1 Tax=Natronomicrosphaera hydrolytica TaxID=3242702 RepID=UPI003CC9188B